MAKDSHNLEKLLIIATILYSLFALASLFSFSYYSKLLLLTYSDLRLVAYSSIYYIVFLLAVGGKLERSFSNLLLAISSVAFFSYMIAFERISAIQLLLVVLPGLLPAHDYFIFASGKWRDVSGKATLHLLTSVLTFVVALAASFFLPNLKTNLPGLTGPAESDFYFFFASLIYFSIYSLFSLLQLYNLSTRNKFNFSLDDFMDGTSGKLGSDD